MGLYKYLRENFKENGILKERLIKWRDEPTTVRIERPTRLDRARSLGYRAKQGIFVLRQRVSRGDHNRPANRAGRHPRHMRRRMILGMAYPWIAESRAQKKYPNCEVLNSYYVAQDGKHYWFEIIMVDKNHPSILADPQLRWIADSNHTRRVYRGLTANGKRSRGILTNFGIGSEKLRPSLKAHKNNGK